jgi:glycosyltransferase involved in cell wall biosynthesis
MRVLVVNQYFYPDQSSTAQLLTELCEDLAEYYDVTVICGRPSYSPVTAARRRGIVRRERYGRVKILRTWSTSFPRDSIVGRLSNYGTYLASSFVGGLMASRPDVVITMTDPPFVALVAMVVSKLRRAPFVYVNQDVFPEVALALGVLREGRTARGLRSLNGHLRSSAAAVVAIGGEMRDRLIALGTPASKVRVIENWADTSAIQPVERVSPMRIAQGWTDRRVVMHSGNVGLSQDLWALVDAAELLHDRHDILIVIVGEGGAKQGLRRRAADKGLDNVLFLPYQPKESLSASLGAADLHFIGLHKGLGGFIVPSKVYGIMAAGRPFLAAVEPGTEPDRIAQAFDCGVTTPPGDPAAIAAGIREAMSLDLPAMGERAREAAVARFDRRIATASYKALLEEVAGRAALRPATSTRA